MCHSVLTRISLLMTLAVAVVMYMCSARIELHFGVQSVWSGVCVKPLPDLKRITRKLKSDKSMPCVEMFYCGG